MGERWLFNVSMHLRCSCCERDGVHRRFTECLNGKKKMFHLTTNLTPFVFDCMASDI